MGVDGLSRACSTGGPVRSLSATFERGTLGMVGSTFGKWDDVDSCAGKDGVHLVGGLAVACGNLGGHFGLQRHSTEMREHP